MSLMGTRVIRTEDPKLLRGEGRYTDDINLARQAHAVIVRSPYAHGVLRGIDTRAAKAMPGVLGIWTGDDLNAAGYSTLTCIIPFPNRDGTPVDQTGDLCERGTFYMDAPLGGQARMETNLLDLMDYIDANYRTKKPSMASVVD